MPELLLEWQEANETKTYILQDRQPSKNPGTVRLGRDPVRCDLVLANPTVSGLHVEIFFHPQHHQFCLRNLRDSNPPVVDGRQIGRGEALLHPGSTIYLGHLLLKVNPVPVVVTGGSIPSTVLVAKSLPGIVSYGLECPHCHRLSTYERIDLGCAWCGTSLAAAASVVMPSSG
ncbi:FHA domain-containing protein [Lusitaniella coriacea]|uniref:FHA domain-containing protein n=1 Tax=Lusitaniella coriacea TaxID=1983105 RepID=UPI003CF513B4